MPSAHLEIAEALDVLVSAHVLLVSHRRDVDCDKPAIAECRVCGADVRAPRRVYCDARCFAVLYGRASDRTLLMRIDRERVLLREQAASHVLRAEVVPSGPIDDGEARVPGEVAARLAALDEWAAKLCVVTSPPYWGLRDYGVEGQLGLEASPHAFVEGLVEVFREVRRVLRSDGTCWVNLGDTYVGSRCGGVGATSITSGRNHRAVAAAATARASRSNRASGLKPKDLVGVPWRVALALQDDGWWLRSDIVWSKPNAMPESVTDRPARSHEYLFLLAKSERYHYDADAIRTPLAEKTLTAYGTTRKSKGTDALGRVAAHNIARDLPKRKPRLNANGEPAGANRRSVWTIATRPYHGAHFATFPPDLVEPCVLAGCPVGGLVLDPFAGSGTTLEVALRLGRRALGIELSPEYARLIDERLAHVQLPLVAGGAA